MEEKLIEREDMRLAWDGFNLGNWSEVIDVRDFIQQNYKPYEGNEEFLVDSSDKTKSLWKKTSDLIQDEIKNRTINVDLETFSGIDNFKPGYIEKDEEPVSYTHLDVYKRQSLIAEDFRRVAISSGTDPNISASVRASRADSIRLIACPPSRMNSSYRPES